MSNPVTDAQNLVADALLANGYFSNVPVITEDYGNYVSMIQEKVAKTTGLCVFVKTPAGTVKLPNAPLQFIFDLEVVIYELVGLNRPPVGAATGTGKSAMDVTCNAMSILHLSNPFINYNGTLVAKGFKRVDYVADGQRHYTAIKMGYQALIGMNVSIPVVATPVITETSAGHFTITCATPGAAIFYTTDGHTYPSPAQGTLYTGAFTATPPVAIAARAWLAGYNGPAYVRQAFNT